MSVVFDRAMIELVREIRRRVPSHIKPDIKLANPYLLSCLQVQYGASSDVVLKTLIQGLFERAGGGWQARLTGPVEVENPAQVARVYRGQVSHTERVPSGPLDDVPCKPKAQRIYRGQPVL